MTLMDGGAIDIVILALIAGFLIYRLRSVLGTRHGEERQRPNPFTAPPKGDQHPLSRGEGAASSDSGARIISLPGMKTTSPPSPDPRPLAETDDKAQTASDDFGGGETPLPLIRKISLLEERDKNFEEKHFLSAATQAFTMILEAFDKGERENLQMLLTANVYQSFVSDITARQREGITRQTLIIGKVDAEIEDIELTHQQAAILVRFKSQQQIKTQKPGSAEELGEVEEIIDLWRFERSLASNDPTWLLAQTRSL
jgi:predicted lipid-binding transport protein (Tim44 family)